MHNNIYILYCLTLLIFLDGVHSAMKWPNPIPTWPHEGSRPPGVTKNLRQVDKSAYAEAFNDELWKNQWYFQDYRGIYGPVMDHNVVPVYMTGINGRGVKVAVLAEGSVDNHPDVSGSSDQQVNVVNEKVGKEPKENQKKYLTNAMQAQGVLSMLVNNTKCGVGVAWGAQVQHVEMAWDACRNAIPPALTSTEADIYQTIWKHDCDDGVTLTEDMNIVRYLLDATMKGRSGKGPIYVVDVGNGKSSKDNCAVDHLVNSVHVISIAAANQKGQVTSYSERCSGVFATAYSGDTGHEGIVTTNVGSSGEFTCQTNGKGTALAATLASGMFALVLQANPGLTYRDVQHIVAMSSEVAPLADNPHSWRVNKAGFWISYDFGFGLLNAENMVRLARFWKRVPELHTCEMKFLERSTLNPGTLVTFTESTDGCQHDADEYNRVKFLEQVELIVNFKYHYRGALRIELTSPSKTTTTILEPRPNDQASGGLSKWRIRSLHTWGEVAQGPWQVSISVQRYSKSGVSRVGEIMDYLVHTSMMAVSNGLWGSYEISDLKLVMHGTWEQPAHYEKSPPYRKKYSIFYVDTDTLPH